MYSAILKHPPLRIFDVTLRDGLQSISKIYSLQEKMDLAMDIIANKSPSAIEIGSIVSPKIVPQMKDSIELFKSFTSFCGTHRPTDVYLLTPNYKSVQVALNNNVCNYSFITAISNSFQMKNINMTIVDTKIELDKMITLVDTIDDNKIKLYISCFTDCPIIGKMDNYTIINETIYYYYTHGEQLDEICLSDTCGTLRFRDFKFILDDFNKRNMDLEKFSLHLHQQPDKQNVKNIITYAMKNGISRFDVSYMPEIGGCTVTIKNPPSNIGYEDIHECL
jgi:hydroxymethylglutaryl-CoA lyase